jgi:tRNA-binding protein
MQISWDDFMKVEIRVGTVITAIVFPEARKPAYQLEIDFGPETGVLRSSAQITVHYRPEDIQGRQVIAVVNFPEKSIAGFKSQCLVLGVYDANNDVILLHPDKPTDNGRKIG